MSLYSYNDWRDYQRLSHSWGTKPEQKAAEKAYNAKYYEEHKAEILKKAKERGRNGIDYNPERLNGGRDFGDSREELVGLAENDEFESLIDDVRNDAKYFDEVNRKHSEYGPDVLENVSKNNQAVLDNISKLKQTVTDFVVKNKGSLSDADMKKLYKDLDHQVALEEKRLINLDSKEGRSYVDSLRK